MRTLVILAAVVVLWQPLAPIRALTAGVLHTTASLIYDNGQ